MNLNQQVVFVGNVVYSKGALGADSVYVNRYQLEVLIHFGHFATLLPDSYKGN